MKINKSEVFEVPATNVVFATNEQFTSAQTQINPRASECLGSNSQDWESFVEVKSIGSWIDSFGEPQIEKWGKTVVRDIALDKMEVLL